MRRYLFILLVVGFGMSLQATVLAQESVLGKIEFPNSGSAEAQESFLNGVRMLHSFEWEDAAEAFQEAQRIDPDFALAYWGEALSHSGGQLLKQPGRNLKSMALKTGSIFSNTTFKV